MRASEYLAQQQWVMMEPDLRAMMALADRTMNAELEALAARPGVRLGNTRVTTVRDGVAIVPVVGPIFRYANLFTEISGATSTQVLATDVRTALDDPLVDAIVLEVNSPGGGIEGIHELSNMIYDARGKKPIVAYADGKMASGAYWIGSAADRIVVDRTAILGSIGALMTVHDTSARDAKAGVRTIEIVSTQSPDKRLDLNQDEGRAKVQKMVDDLGAIFVETVARNRGVDIETVLSDFGRGGVLIGEQAVAAGMANAVGSLESVITELASNRTNRRSVFMSGRTAAKGAILVATTDALRAALAAGHTGEEITLDLPDVAGAVKAATDKAAAEFKVQADKDIADARADGVKTERARILGIQNIAVKGFEAEVSAAIESGASVEATAVKITSAIRERGVSVQGIADRAPGAVGHGGKASDKPESEVQAAQARTNYDTIAARMNGKRAG